MVDEQIDVKAIRELLGWSQQQLAEHCCTDRSTVSRWEAEPPTRGPALVVLRQLREQAIAEGAAATAARSSSAAPAEGPRSVSENGEAAA